MKKQLTKKELTNLKKMNVGLDGAIEINGRNTTKKIELGIEEDIKGNIENCKKGLKEAIENKKLIPKLQRDRLKAIQQSKKPVKKVKDNIVNHIQNSVKVFELPPIINNETLYSLVKDCLNEVIVTRKDKVYNLQILRRVENKDTKLSKKEKEMLKFIELDTNNNINLLFHHSNLKIIVKHIIRDTLELSMKRINNMTRNITNEANEEIKDDHSDFMDYYRDFMDYYREDIFNDIVNYEEELTKPISDKNKEQSKDFQESISQSLKNAKKYSKIQKHEFPISNILDNKKVKKFTNLFIEEFKKRGAAEKNRAKQKTSNALFTLPECKP